MPTIGTRLRKFREARNFSTIELAALSTVGQSTISAIENDHQSPRVKTLELLCGPLNIRLIDLISEDSEFNQLPEKLLKLISRIQLLKEEELDKLASVIEAMYGTGSGR
jgi:transcriptional regulator with XRE-family HTH domain